MRHRLHMMLILLAASSCIDDSGYSIHSVSVSPSLAIPLVSGNLFIQGILNNKDSSYIKIDSDSLVYVEYSNTLLSSDIRNLFKIPDKTGNQTFVLKPGLLPAHANDIRSDSVTIVVDLGLSPEQLSAIDFKAGTIAASAQLSPASPNLPFEVVLSSSDLISNSTHQKLYVTAGSGSVPLSDYTATLNKNRFNLKMVLIFKGPSSAVTINPNTSIAVQFSMAGMDFTSIAGFFGDQTVFPPSTTLNLGAFGNTLQSANVSFAQPKVTLNIVNDYGAPCQVTFLTFEARKRGAALSAQLNPASPMNINVPVALGNSATTPVIITNANSLVDFGPTSFYYNLNARINKGLVSGINFLADTSQLKVTLDVQMPLYGHGSKISLSDTSALDLSKLNQSQVGQASLKVTITNELPLDAKIQFYFTDDKYKIIDSLLTTAQTALVKGSSVTPAGDLLAAGVVDQLLPLNSSALNNLFTSKYIIIKAVMNTSGNTVDVKFKSNYTMQVNLGLLADLKINVTF